jgi:hypothetical protein
MTSKMFKFIFLKSFPDKATALEICHQFYYREIFNFQSKSIFITKLKLNDMPRLKSMNSQEEEMNFLIQVAIKNDKKYKNSKSGFPSRKVVKEAKRVNSFLLFDSLHLRLGFFNCLFKLNGKHVRKLHA